MRHVILVIGLIGAAFLGGAFVNGPGLRWAQTQVLGTLGFGDEDEIASINLKSQADGGPGAPGGTANTRKPRQGSQGLDEPIAPAPSVLADKGAAPHDLATHDAAAPLTDARPKKRPSEGKSGVSEEGGLAPVMLPADALTGRLPPKPAKEPTVEPNAELLPPLMAAPANDSPADGNVTTAADRDKTAGGRPPIRASATELGPKSDLVDPLASLAPALAQQPDPGNPGRPASPNASAPSTLPLAPSTDRPSPRLPASGARNGRDSDWSELARKMQALGVSKFSVEGEPGGRVVFSCLIPLAGKQAVTQRFEADGDDIVQAVQATLRRIALWRATQPAERAGGTP